MKVYEVVKFLHVLLAIAAVGANMTYGIWISRAAREPRALSFALRGVKILDDRIANPAYVLLFVTGAAMVFLGRLSWTTPWLLAALVLYACVAAVGLAGYTPTLRRQIASLDADGPESPIYRTLAARGTALGIVLAVLVVLIVFLMVTKPVLWG